MPSWYRDPAAPEPNVSRRVGVTALIERAGEFLVERRVDDLHVWAFIGGTLEEDELALAGLHREVREETGYEIDEARLLGIFSDPSRILAYPDGTVCRVLSIAFLVKVKGAEKPRLSGESAGMRFVSRDELATLAFWPAQQPIRNALLDDDGEVVVS